MRVKYGVIFNVNLLGRLYEKLNYLILVLSMTQPAAYLVLKMGDGNKA